METRARLEDLMLRYGLRRRDIARFLGKPLNSAGGYSNSTVDRWLSGDHRVPGFALELLEMKLADRTERADPWQRLIRQPVPYGSQREMEVDLARVLSRIEQGKLPRMGRGGKALALRRAGYWLELIAQLGGPRFREHRQALLDEAGRLRERVDGMEPVAPLRVGDTRPRVTMDDLARKWGLAPGADIRRFRQLSHTGRV